MDKAAKRPLTFQIVSLLHDTDEALGSGMIARRLHIAADKVQSAIPNLVRRGIVSRAVCRGKSYAQYSVDEDQWSRYLGSLGVSQCSTLSAQSNEALSRKLRFFNNLMRGVHADNPVLAEIIADYQTLRRRQAEMEEQ